MIPLNYEATTLFAVALLVPLCAFFAWCLWWNAKIFYRQWSEGQKRAAFSGAAVVIAIIAGILAGVFSSSARLTPPPAKKHASIPGQSPV